MPAFDTFFRALSEDKQQKFADLAGYQVGYIRKHLAAPQWRRKRPRATGYTRLVMACRLFPTGPRPKELIDYFYGNGR